MGACAFPRCNKPPFAPRQEAGTYLLNELRAHAAAYKVIKAMPGGGDVEVGLVHNVFWMEPKGSGPFYSHVKCAMLGSFFWPKGEAGLVL